MNSPGWIHDCLLRRFDSVITEIRRVSQKEHPFAEPGWIHRFLIEVLKNRKSRFKEDIKLLSNYATDSDEHQKLSMAVKANIPQFYLTLCEIENFFFSFRGFDSHRIPFELLKPLSWATDHLFGRQEFRVMVCLATENNYKIMHVERKFHLLGLSRDWSNYCKANHYLGEDGISPDILFLFFPSAEAHNVPLHAIAAHEIGHRFYFEQKGNIESIRKSTISAILQTNTSIIQDYILQKMAISEKPVRRVDCDKYDIEQTRFRTRLNEIVENWLSELVADLVAATLVGPAFMAAEDRAFVVPANSDDTHPSTEFRRHFVNGYLVRYFPNVLALRDWNFLLCHWPQTKHSLLYEEAENVLLSMKSAIEDLAYSINCHPFQVSEDVIHDMTDMAFEHFRNLAPPNLIFSKYPQFLPPQRFWFTIFVAWLYLLDDKFEQFNDECGWEREKGEEFVTALTLNALQAIEIEDGWSSFINDTSGVKTC